MELLVVIVLVTTLVTTAIPILSPGGDRRKIREASRAVNAFFAGAQARAIETGRPYGVAIRRLSADTGDPEDNGAGVALSYVETPPAFSGLDPTSAARLCETSVGNLRQIQLQVLRRVGTPSSTPGVPAGWELDAIPPRFLRPGDTIFVLNTPYVMQEGDGTTTVSTGAEVIPGLQIIDPELRYFPPIGIGAQAPSRINLVPRNDLALTSNFDDNFGLLPFNTLRAGERFSVNLRPRYDRSGFVVEDGQVLVEQRVTPTLPVTSLAEISSLRGFDGAGLDDNVGPGLVDNGGPFWTEPAPYQIFRQPTPTTSPPLQLPAGAAIDLAASGFLSGPALHRKSNTYLGADTLGAGAARVLNDDLVVMFSPEGSIASVTLPNPDTDVSEETTATSSLALLIGRRELIPAPEEDGGAGDTRDDPIDLARFRGTLDDAETQETLAAYNWLNGDSRWVVIGAQTGSVTTVENTAISAADIPADANRFGFADQLAVARSNALTRQTLGGR